MAGSCIGIVNVCQPNWQCEQPLNGFENDGCGNRRTNPACNPPCIPEWVCEPGQTGYEIDGCGNRRANPACLNTGSLTFTSFPSGAEIFIDGQDQGVTTPATINDIPIGSHSYVLKLEGFKDSQGTAEVLENQTVAVPLAELIPNEGCIYFNISPAGAKIIVDNVDTGQVTPSIVCGLTLGSHTYRLELAGYQPVTGTAGIGAGYGKTVTATMVEEKKGIGAGTILGIMTAVGLVGIGLVMASKEKEQPPIRTRSPSARWGRMSQS